MRKQMDKEAMKEIRNKTLAHIKNLKRKLGKDMLTTPHVDDSDLTTTTPQNLIATTPETGSDEVYFRANHHRTTDKQQAELDAEEQLKQIIEDFVTTKSAAHAYAHRITRRLVTVRTKPTRTTPHRVYFDEDCDYVATFCMKAYETGTICGRTMYYLYQTFDNYCLLDYVNCMERYEIWQIVHMGECFRVDPLTEYITYPYDDDYFLDDYYVVEQA